MRDLAVIAKIQSIQEIEGYDRVELATVENYPVIVGKNEFKEGDLVVYVFYDTILPERKEFEFLRKRCWSKLYGGFRIRNMKMCGVFSSGIVFKTNILPSDVKIVEGKNVEKELDVKKYDPETLKELQDINQNTRYSKFQKFLLKFKIFRYFILGKKRKTLPFPPTVQKSDEENVQRLFNTYKRQFDHHTWYVTEKLEGQSVTYLTEGKKKKYHVYSRNTHRPKNGNGNWETLGRELNMENRLKAMPRNYAIQGEIVGKGIQGNIYKFESLGLYIFKVTDVDSGEQLNFDELLAFCIEYEFSLCPVLYMERKLPDSVKEIIAEAEGRSIVFDVPREGVVWRSKQNQHLSFKAKSQSYAIWFEGKTKTE